MKRTRYYNNWEIPGAIKNMSEALDRFNQANLRRIEAANTAKMFGVAALYETTVIAQIASKLPSHIRRDNTSIHWGALSDFRNALAHTTSEVEMNLIGQFMQDFFHQLHFFTQNFRFEGEDSHA